MSLKFLIFGSGTVVYGEREELSIGNMGLIGAELNRVLTI